MSAVKPKANNQGKKVVKINDKNSASSSTSTPKQSEKIKKLQDEITELKAKLNMYQYHMDPIKLEEKFGIPEDSLVNMLRNENAELRMELAKFTSGITIKRLFHNFIIYRRKKTLHNFSFLFNTLTSPLPK
ncbi:uncharacterized protein LOC132753046 [Ruditapes philippinarum]|uniref:uncharacterized protein LOC132753046 n=1 Tax=Ruditapes philippinarum TaxID=129788 RepID=UPI00295C2DF0|nr:uncharacterized protein LOC132753046 [Ruditapes philippinarum]XP_060599440.1 uncharacterized protein LOC132753046 [Ruditapes philippinarum]